MDAKSHESLQRYYDEHLGQAQQHEVLRAQATSILSAISAGVVGIAGLGGLSRSDVPAGVLVVLVAGLGVVISLKHYERYKFHARILDRVRREIEGASSARKPATPDDILQEVTNEHYSSWSLRAERRAYRELIASNANPSPLPRLRLHVLWALVPGVIGVAGVLVVTLALLEVS